MIADSRVEQHALDVRVDDGVSTLHGKTNHIAPGTPIVQEYELLNFVSAIRVARGGGWMRTKFRRS